MRSRALSAIFSILLLAALTGCAPTPEQTAPAGAAAAAAAAAAAVDLAADEQAIRDSSQQWLAAEQGRDLLTTMSFMDADVVTIFDGSIARGRAEVEDAAQGRWDEFPDGTIEWTASSVVVAASGDLAYERGTWSFDPDGAGSAAPESGEFVTIWHKVDGEWKVVVDAGSTIKADSA